MNNIDRQFIIFQELIKEGVKPLIALRECNKLYFKSEVEEFIFNLKGGLLK